MSRLKRLAGPAGALAVVGFVLTLAAVSALAQGRGSARLTITRNSDFLYALAPASVAVNGDHVASVAREATVTVVVPAGQNTVTVTGFVHPGASSVALNMRPGGHYAVEISPRTEGYVPAALFGLAGAIVDAGVNKNSGAFNIRVTRR